jgi:glyoxylase-like metal-dependent hydrolase (beta-lactamase superfamily II)
MQIVDGATDVMGDGRIVLLPLPGHTPGMMGALVRLHNGGDYLLASDALNIRENLDRDIIPRNTWNIERCAESFAEIRRIEASGAKIICGHDAAQWDGLRKGLDAYD